MNISTISRRLFIIFSICAPLGNVARADLYDDYINSSSRRPFISFLARRSGEDADRGFPGHSYIAEGFEIDNGLKIYTRILGYYMQDESVKSLFKGVLSKTSGKLDQKLEDILWDVNFTVLVDEAQTKKAGAVIDKWMKEDPSYNLFASGGKNCSSFASEVAVAIGLKVPSNPGSKLPIKFMRELRDLNK